MNKYQTTKLLKTTLQKLRMIYALTGENLTIILERLVQAELEKVQRGNKMEE